MYNSNYCVYTLHLSNRGLGLHEGPFVIRILNMQINETSDGNFCLVDLHTVCRLTGTGRRVRILKRGGHVAEMRRPSQKMTSVQWDGGRWGPATGSLLWLRRTGCGSLIKWIRFTLARQILLVQREQFDRVSIEFDWLRMRSLCRDDGSTRRVLVRVWARWRLWRRCFWTRWMFLRSAWIWLRWGRASAVCRLRSPTAPTSPCWGPRELYRKNELVN